MGYSISWVATDASCERALFDHFGAKEIAGTSETTEYWEHIINGMRHGEWYVLLWDHQDFLIDEQLLTKLSAHGRLVAVMVEEHTMFASAEEWSEGKRIWGAVHSCDLHLMHIGAEGQLPDVYWDILALHVQKQNASGGPKAGVDHIMDIPIELAKAVIGYRHDEGEYTWSAIEVQRVPRESSTKHRPIDGVSATEGIQRGRSIWYQNHKASQPGLFARVFGKRQ